MTYLWKKIKELFNCFDKHSTSVVAISTIILVMITAYYAYKTADLTEIAQEQMVLNSEPHINFYSKLRPNILQVKDSTINFSIENLSHSDLVNFNLQLSFHFHLIDTTILESFIEYKTLPSSYPDYYLPIFHKKTKRKLTVDLRPYIPTISSDSGYFFVKKSLRSEGNWKKINLRQSFGFMFSIFKFTYSRENDAKEFVREFFFRNDDTQFSIEGSLFYPVINLEEIITTNRRFIQRFWEIEDFFPRR